MKRPLRLGIAGAGGAAGLIGEALRDVPDVELRACAARTQESAERFAREHGATRAYAGLDGLLADEAVEAIYLATPNALHYAQALAALEAGKHVLVEKPMTLRLAEAEELAYVPAYRGLVVGVGFHLRHSDIFRELKRLLDEGAVGEPRLVRAAWGMPLPELSGWKQDRAAAGAGALMGLGVHVLDLVLWLVEAAPGAVAKTITSGGSPRTGPEPPGPGAAPKHVAAVSDARGDQLDRTYAIVLGIGGCLAEISVSRSFALGASLEVFGSEGSLHADAALTVRAEGTLRDGEGTILAEARTNPYAAELTAFADAVRGGRPFHADARDGLRCVELTEAVLAGTAPAP